MVLSVGAATSNSRISAEAQQELAISAEEARINAHGVSLDEEMVMLSQYQRSYEAAARVINAIDQMLDTLINRIGV
jgi:flagellar hook-associated protein 1 FlgK